ncbi:competence protein ComK [Sutcliffiella cohnii]
MDEYIINSSTIAILPHFHPFLQTQVLEWEGEYNVKEKPLYIINKNCLHYGSSYIGRREAIVHRTNYKQKTPILLSESQELIIIPTHSPEHMDCVWLMFHQVHKVASINSGSTITFHNGRELSLPVSAEVIHQQMQKASVIHSLFCTNQKFSFMVDKRKKKLDN